MKLKITLSLAIGLLFSSLGFAQDLRIQDVPSVVLNSFKQAFPNAKDAEWERKSTLYNVEFDIRRMDHEVWMDAKGTIVKHKQELRVKDLPTVVSQKIKLDNPGLRIDDVDKITEGNQTYYKVELKNRQTEITIVVDQAGNVVDKHF